MLALLRALAEAIRSRFQPHSAEDLLDGVLAVEGDSPPDHSTGHRTVVLATGEVWELPPAPEA